MLAVGARGVVYTRRMLGALLFVMAQAATGARPSECAPLETQQASNVWERAKSPALRHYCDLLAGGAAKLAAGGGIDDAREALALADEASAAFPDRAAPNVLRGRALARLGRWSEASKALALARSRDDRALDDPAALFAWGRALGRAGQTADAEAAFRALLPRAASLPLADRGAAEIEAALLAQTRGPSGLDAAIAMLRQARREAQDAMQSMVAMALALALDRADQRDESRLVLASIAHGDPRAVLADAHVREVLSDVNAVAEADALIAVALDASEPAAAHDAWARYVAGPGGKGPWGDHARARETHRARGAR